MIKEAWVISKNKIGEHLMIQMIHRSLDIDVGEFQFEYQCIPCRMCAYSVTIDENGILCGMHCI
jgi:hypothetical protein